MPTPAFPWLPPLPPSPRRKVELSDEQKQRIEHNRNEALAKRQRSHAADIARGSAAAAIITGPAMFTTPISPSASASAPTPVADGSHHTASAAPKGAVDVWREQPSSQRRVKLLSWSPFEQVNVTWQPSQLSAPVAAGAAVRQAACDDNRAGTEGPFRGMNGMHGPSHSDHMEEKMRYPGYFEQRNAKLRQQGEALRSGGPGAKVYRQLAATLRASAGAAERTKPTSHWTQVQGDSDECGQAENPISSNVTTAVTWWRTECGHTMQVLRPKSCAASASGAWKIRLFGPTVQEAGGYMSLKSRPNMQDALLKAAEHLGVAVDSFAAYRGQGDPQTSTRSESPAAHSEEYEGGGGAGSCKQAPDLVPSSLSPTRSHAQGEEVGGTNGRGTCAPIDRKPSVFEGCVVYFDGRTGLHSALHLSKLIMMYGGICSVTFSKRKVTHGTASESSSGEFLLFVLMPLCSQLSARICRALRWAE